MSVRANCTDDTSVVDPSAADIQKHVRMTVFISKVDEGFENPRIFVEQLVFKNRCKRIVVHQLAFEGKIQCDVDYRFAGCGDEAQPGKPRDLILRVKSVSFSRYHSEYRHCISNSQLAGWSNVRQSYGERGLLRV